MCVAWSVNAVCPEPYLGALFYMLRCTGCGLGLQLCPVWLSADCASTVEWPCLHGRVSLGPSCLHSLILDSWAQDCQEQVPDRGRAGRHQDKGAAQGRPTLPLGLVAYWSEGA